MTNAVFDELLLKGIRAGQIPARTQAARNWYRDKAKGVGKLNDEKFMRLTEHKERYVSNVKIGGMYLFAYNAKHKDTLAYWDRLPLVFPFKKVSGGFLGLNMHYLPLQYRAKLMDALYEIANNDKFDETTKLKLNYQVLQSAAKYRYFSPTVHHYLTEQMMTRFMAIHSTEWDIALFLPLERFQKATKQDVWKDSKNKIKGLK